MLASNIMTYEHDECSQILLAEKRIRNAMPLKNVAVL